MSCFFKTYAFERQAAIRGKRKRGPHGPDGSPCGVLVAPFAHTAAIVPTASSAAIDVPPSRQGSTAASVLRLRYGEKGVSQRYKYDLDVDKKKQRNLNRYLPSSEGVQPDGIVPFISASTFKSCQVDDSWSIASSLRVALTSGTWVVLLRETPSSHKGDTKPPFCSNNGCSCVLACGVLAFGVFSNEILLSQNRFLCWSFFLFFLFFLG